MSKVCIHFPRQVEWGDRVIEKGANVFETDDESVGFVDRCLKRGCTIVEESVSSDNSDNDQKKEDDLPKLTPKETLQKECEEKGIDHEGLTKAQMEEKLTEPNE